MGSTFVGTPVLPATGAETLADMTLRVARRVCHMVEGKATDGSTTTLVDVDTLTEPTGTYDGGILWLLSGSHAGEVVEKITSQTTTSLLFRPLATTLCVKQVETLTVLGTVTGTGNATVVVTAVGMNGTPKTLDVAVTNLDSATIVAGKVRTALGADSDVIQFFTVGGSGAVVTLTAQRAASNSDTMNISIANGTCTGLTTVASSTNTTAGVDGPYYALAERGVPYSQLVSGINRALSKVYTGAEDVTLTGDGTTLQFNLPAGVFNVYEVYGTRPNSVSPEEKYLKAHWTERNGKLIFDNLFPPQDDEVLHVWYASPHAALHYATDTIDDEVNLDWLEAAATFNVLMWAKAIFENDFEYDVVTRLQVVNEELKSLTSNKRARVRIHSAGTVDYAVL